ncbi:tetratricopeptide repeat protein [Streptomyces sp. NPDC007905]|uniref:tetratricopeptide repeat protein n=1 Tax=Streptomyces sp. NPDC007905 TaxID=3364788 RepID=UPI0036F0B977
MKRRKLWAGLAGTAALATGVTVWVMLAHPAASPVASNTSATPKPQQVATLLRAANLQAQYHDFAGATRTFRQVLAIEPRNKVAWYDLGVVAHQQGKTADALKAYDKALQIDHKYASALYNEAVLLKPSDPDRAAELLKRAITATPKAATAHLQLGLILASKDRDDEAEDEFRRAVAADPSLHSQVPEPYRDDVSPSPTSSQAGATK